MACAEPAPTGGKTALNANPTPIYWPLLVYAACVVALLVLMLGLSYVLGQRHREPATGQTYESGIVSQGSARLRMSAKFFLLAVFFVIFDLEVIFLVAWAVAARALGWAGYAAAAAFIGVLGVALAYLWRAGALDWGTTALLLRRREEQAPAERAIER
jgi:NADH-quinone oxidoreductase subunit A